MRLKFEDSSATLPRDLPAQPDSNADYVEIRQSLEGDRARIMSHRVWN